MLFSFTLTTLWYDRQRFVPGVLAIAFSSILVTVGMGMLWGLFATTSAPIDHAGADVWVGAPQVLSLDLGRPISETHASQLANQPGVGETETYVLDYYYWMKPNGSKELCIVIGSRLWPGALGAVRELTPALRDRLSEPGSVVIDEAEMGRLGVQKLGQVSQLAGKSVRVVGFVRGLKSLTAPYVFCSLETARWLLPILPDQTTYVLARCPDPAQAQKVVRRMRAKYSDISAFTRDELSLRTRMHWLVMTNAGVSAAFMTSLGLLVGAVVTSQTLYAATVASLREYAVLRALGIARARIAAAVMMLSFWIGVAGAAIALPVVLTLANLADMIGTTVLLPFWLLSASGTLIIGMAVVSGLVALRSLRFMEPAALLR